MSSDSAEPYEFCLNSFPDKKFAYCARDGAGRSTFPNEDNYEGQFLNGKRHGEGKYTWANGSSYEGSYVNGVREGFGRMVYADRSVYIGQWKNNQRSGEGNMTYKNGDKYSGNWQDNVRHGEGHYVYRSDLSEVRGRWLAGRFVGGQWQFYKGKLFSAQVKGNKMIKYENK